jgi:hypothetical protein
MKTTAQEVKDVMDRFLGGNAVRRVDMVLKRDKQQRNYKTLFVHFNQWPDTEKARQVEADILVGKAVNVHYSDRGFWKCAENKMPEPRDLRTDSIFIPRVDADTTEDQIKATFATGFYGPDDESKSSHITRINVIPKTDRNGKPYQAAYVHFAEWEMTDSAKHFFRDAGAERGANLRYDQNPRDFWKCVLNRNTMGSGSVVDKRDQEKEQEKVAVGPYISVNDIQPPAPPPTTPTNQQTPATVSPPALRRTTAMGSRARVVEGADGDHTVDPQSLLAAFNAAETSKRNGISNVPAWMDKLAEDIHAGNEKQLVEEGEVQQQGEEMV